MLSILSWPTCAALAAVLLATGTRAIAERTETRLNSGWRFHYGETAGAEAASFDDSAWTQIDVPHTWNAFDGQDGVKDRNAVPAGLRGDYARGTGWYRRVIPPSADWASRRVYLQFDGANRRADVFLNGRLIGTHLGGNARFRFDLSDVLQRGEPNLLAVKVNNEDNAIIPHSADFTFFGGIYRDVTLLVTDAVQIETMDYASPGVYLRQVSVTPERAEIQARVKLANHESRPADVAVRITIVDTAGHVVAETRTIAALAANGRGDVTMPLTDSCAQPTPASRWRVRALCLRPDAEQTSAAGNTSLHRRDRAVPAP